MLEKRTRRATPMTGWKKDVKFLKRSKSPIVLLQKYSDTVADFSTRWMKPTKGLLSLQR